MRKEKNGFTKYLMQNFCLFVCFFLTTEINKSVHNNDFNTVDALCVFIMWHK